ncbi:YobA family protein [Psychrobacillus psychrodurans]|uniref:YobA family protein n=1 Tax=Psychrobacillus psychrodurans TaxID=126157 RepID=A0A9X3RAS4_9BACI|nr:YobA family protein [Psychrobacillus psychrodurans]MCZ8534451.1 YobA family protein [Psychrobacillus psychrodurans]
MKGKYTVGILITIVLVAIGASFYFIMQFFEDNPTQPQQPTDYIEGVIIDIQDTSILVIGGLSVDEAKNMSVEEALESGNDATWFSLTMDQRNSLKSYDEVKVGYTELDESYPSKGTAKTIEKINE